MSASSQNSPVLVVKIGSSSLVDRQGRLDAAFLAVVARQLKAVADLGWRPVLVSSGAVASGLGILGLPARPNGLSERQALAAIGQASLAHRWQEALAAEDLVAAQVLLTNADFTDRARYLNLTAAFRSLFAYHAVPVINENDTVAVEELTVGDNDRLSALVATQLHAQLLVLLTDIDGVYDADPRTHPEAKLVREMHGVPPKMLGAAGGGGKLGRGGMRSKLEAARLASGAGVATVIAPARVARVIERVVDGDETLGTRIHPRAEASADGRRRWLAVARKVKGQIHIDAGAAAALVRQGKSLLPIGITAVSGRFERGDTVAVVGADGEELARGLVSLSSVELALVAGKRAAAANAALGYAMPKAAIHRDNLLVLAPE